MKEQTKCHPINLIKEQDDRLNSISEITGKSKRQILSEFIDAGLKKAFLESKYKKMFLVRVRIDTAKVMEMGQKLQNGDLDTSHLLLTYCIKDDFTVGVNIWIAKDREHFEKLFAPHKKYYSEVLSIEEVIFPKDALKLILKQQP